MLRKITTRVRNIARKAFMLPGSIVVSRLEGRIVSINDGPELGEYKEAKADQEYPEIFYDPHLM